MSDRLAELRRQRALVQTHLAWLDAEIARTAGTLPPAAPASSASAAPAAAAGGALPPVAATEDPPRMVAAADTILEEYRVPESTLKSDVRKGCFLYFIAAFAAVAAGVLVLYFLFRAAR